MKHAEKAAAREHFDSLLAFKLLACRDVFRCCCAYGEPGPTQKFSLRGAGDAFVVFRLWPVLEQGKPKQLAEPFARLVRSVLRVKRSRGRERCSMLSDVSTRSVRFSQEAASPAPLKNSPVCVSRPTEKLCVVTTFCASVP